MAWDYALVGLAAFVASVVSGVGGFGGGFIIVLMMTPIVGAKAVVPLISVFAIFGNLSRLIVYRRTVAWRLAIRFTLASLPGVALGTRFLAAVPESVFLAFLGLVLLAAIPARRYLKRRAFEPGLRTMLTLGFVFGFVSGTAAGSGMLVIAFFNSIGLQGTLLLGTDALIGLVNALFRSGAFFGLGLLDGRLVTFGVLMGLVTWPGTWVASRLVARMGPHRHGLLIEGLVVVGGIIFLAQAAFQLLDGG